MQHEDNIYEIVISKLAVWPFHLDNRVVQTFIDHIRHHPDTIIHLAKAVLYRLSGGSTLFDLALSFLPQEQWPEVVVMAIAALQQNNENSAAASILQYAGLQCPQATHPYLEQIFSLTEYTSEAFQDWGASNNRENLHRVGGHPTWIQGGHYPQCPICNTPSTFLMQLASDLPLDDGDAIAWDDSGIAYLFWCDTCKVSSFLTQSA